MRTQLNCSAVELYKLYFRRILQAAFIVQFDECFDGETFWESVLLLLIENWELQFELILLYTTRLLQCRSFHSLVNKFPTYRVNLNTGQQISNNRFSGASTGACCSFKFVALSADFYYALNREVSRVSEVIFSHMCVSSTVRSSETLL